MMNYKETLFFIAKCLTINHEKKNYLLIEDQLKADNINWEAVVKVSTGQFVFPALYCNLKRAKFLHYLPEDLVAYMEHITELNRERNLEIIAQAKEVNQLLLKNNITPIFLKGTGNLIEDLYDDIAERMVGDIDFIVSKDNFKQAIAILKQESYTTNNEVYMDFHWHYPKMVKKGRIAAVEIHNKVLKKPFTSILDYPTLKENAVFTNSITVASYENQLLVTVLQKQINDNLYFSKSISLRNAYDSFLISKKYNIEKRTITNKTAKKYVNNYKSCLSVLFNSPESISFNNNKEAKKYTNSFLLILDNSKSENKKVKLINSYVKIKDKIKILQYSFTDKEYSAYTFRRFKDFNFYIKNLGLKKPKLNS